jgi:hypothetical protein
MSYLTDTQINEMADAAFTAYEMSCSWGRAFEDARDHAVNEFGITPRKSAVLLAVKLAKVQWAHETKRVRRIITGEPA